MQFKDLKNFKFTEDIKQKWATAHATLPLTDMDIRNASGAYCAIGTFLQVLEDEGYGTWVVKGGTIPWEFLYGDDETSHGYVVLDEIKFMQEVVRGKSFVRYMEVYQTNDNAILNMPIDKARFFVVDYIKSIPVEA